MSNSGYGRCIFVFCISLVVVLSIVILGTPESKAGVVEIKQHQLHIDGQPQPQLWGAEIQYFRLRGGPGRNIPRATVLALWNRVLDRVVEAKMNMVSFYIPWDFHEYAEGKFDFDGTVDEDGDGQADFPSRDVRTFLGLIERRGIRHIMARPGPYINAEWGFLGFGAVPLWFHEKYPQSHAQDSQGQRTTLYSYFAPTFLKATSIWLKTVYEQVLKNSIGPGKPISFIQVDNETNFMWQSIYNHDYSPLAIAGYHAFLKEKYTGLSDLNKHHGRRWPAWGDVRPPVRPGENLAEDQDWYRFQDFSMYDYLRKIRRMWDDLGVRQPTVLFTLAESFNAPEHGVLPNYRWRNSPDSGMMTVNLYPKTYETPDSTLMNLPFKADHDVKAADAASDYYLGRSEQWVLGSEIQGGWWRGVPVSLESRRQTYLTTLGHGLKALMVYYFHEGENWQHDWMKQLIEPEFNTLKNEYHQRPASGLEKNFGAKDFPPSDFWSMDVWPDEFWRKLDRRVAKKHFSMDTRHIWHNGGTQPAQLYFDAALDGNGEPRWSFDLLKEIGEKYITPYGSFLGKAVAVEDPVCLIKTSDDHAPSPVPKIISRIVQSDWAGGLLALLMHNGINARVLHWDLNQRDLENCRLAIYQDTGLANEDLVLALTQSLEEGRAVLSFIHTDLAQRILVKHPSAACTPLPARPMEVQGYSCVVAKGHLYQARVPIYDVFNTDFYFLIHDARERAAVIDNILSSEGISPHLKIVDADRTVAFARTAADQTLMTVKTSRRDGFSGRLRWLAADPTITYAVTDIFSQVTTLASGSELIDDGIAVTLGNSGSTALFLKPAQVVSTKTETSPKP